MKNLDLNKILEEIGKHYSADFFDALNKQEGIQTFLFGGMVRDSLMRREWKDLDIRILINKDWDEREKELEDILHKFGEVKEKIRFEDDDFTVYRFWPQGSKKKQDIDISLSTTIDKAKSDFTINDLFFDLATGELIDNSGGVEDLRNGILRMVEEPSVRLRTYPFEILRAIKSACQFGLKIEDEVMGAMKSHSGLVVNELSYIRDKKDDMWSEFLLGALLRGLHYDHTRYSRLMNEAGLVGVIQGFLAGELGVSKKEATDSIVLNLEEVATFEEKISHFLSEIARILDGSPEDNFTKIKNILALDIPKKHGELNIDVAKIQYS